MTRSSLPRAQNPPPSFTATRATPSAWRTALAAAGAVGALSPLALAAPAAAAPASPSPTSTSSASQSGSACPAGFGATAASELLSLRLLDLSPVGGVGLPTVANLRAGTTHAGMAGGPARAGAEAHQLRVKALGIPVPAGVLGTHAYQAAPPSHETPSTVAARGVDLGALQLGAGTLSAHATWANPARCEPVTGPRSRSTATLVNAAVLPRTDDRGLLRLSAVQSTTATEIVDEQGRPAASATATGSLAQVRLLSGTPAAISVKVISQPRLEVVAGAQKRVRYTAPVLEVTIPGKAPQRLSAPGAHVDIAVPVDAASTGLAGDLARTEGIAALPAVPLATLLSGLSNVDGPAATGESTATPELPVPGLEALLDGLLGTNPAPESSATPESRARRGGRVIVLRLSIGELTKRTNDIGVHATAASLRVQVLVRSKWAGHDSGDGYGGAPADKTTVLDLGVCVLDAAAAAPKGGLPPYGGGGNTGTPAPEPSGSPSPSPGGSHNGESGSGVSSGSLPVTGSPVALAIGLGTLLVLAGRLLMLATRRRFGG